MLERSIANALNPRNSGFTTPRDKLVVLEYRVAKPGVPGFTVRMEMRQNANMINLHGYTTSPGYNNTGPVTSERRRENIHYGYIYQPVNALAIKHEIQKLQAAFKRKHRLPRSTRMNLVAAHKYMKRHVRGYGTRFANKRNLKQNYPRYLVPKWRQTARKRAQVRTASAALSRHGLDPNTSRKVMNMAFPARLR